MSDTSSAIEGWDPLAPPNWNDPYPDYARLREEDPVHWAPETGVFCVSRYDDVADVLRDTATFSSQGAFEILVRRRRFGFGDAMGVVRFLWRARINPLKLRNAVESGMLITVDPPRHTELRATVNRGFTPRLIKDLEPRLRQIVDGCLAPVLAADRFDLVKALNIPLPVTVIAELLGIDPARQDDFKRWSDAIVAGSSGSETADIRPFLAAMGDITAFFRQMIAERRGDPRDDILSVLLDPEFADIMNDAAISQFLVLLLIAGNETTTNLIGNAVATFLAHPGELARVQADPALLPLAIEEVLRFEPPVHFVFRRATRDAEIAGTPIPAGSRVAALLASANRDATQFADPDRFDVARNPKGHLSFGLGAHFCLGASLARLEARVALEALLPHLGERRLADEQLEWVDSFLVRGPARMDLVAA